MFDFEKLDVYHVVKEQTTKVINFVREQIDVEPSNLVRWKESNLDILLNLAEGTSKQSKGERKAFLNSARSSVFKSMALMDVLKESQQISDEFYQELYEGYEKSSKMLLGMIRSFSNDDSRPTTGNNYNSSNGD
jgi:four helix bundle protein